MPKLPDFERRLCEDPAAELARLEAALDVVRAGPPGAWLLALDDPALLDDARRRIEQGYCNAEPAWLDAVEAYAGGFEDEDAPSLGAAAVRGFRPEDLLEAGRRVLRALVDYNSTQP